MGEVLGIDFLVFALADLEEAKARPPLTTLSYNMGEGALEALGLSWLPSLHFPWPQLSEKVLGSQRIGSSR